MGAFFEPVASQLQAWHVCYARKRILAAVQPFVPLQCRDSLLHRFVSRMGVLRVGEVGIAWEAVGRVMDEGGGIGVTEVIGKVLWGGVLQSANRGVACVGAGKRSEEILLLDSSMEMIIFQHKRFILQPEITTQLSLPTDKCGRIGPLSADTHPTLGIAYLGQSSAVISYSLMVTNKVKVVFGKQSHNFELEPAHSMADLLRAVGSKFNLVA